MHIEDYVFVCSGDFNGLVCGRIDRFYGVH